MIPTVEPPSSGWLWRVHHSAVSQRSTKIEQIIKYSVVDPHKKNRIRIQLLVNDFCEFYFPCYVLPSLYFRFLKRVIYLYLYIKNLIKEW